MPKQTPAAERIADAATSLLAALVSLQKNDDDHPAIPFLRSAIYHTSLASLAIICPEELEAADVIGKPKRHRRPTDAAPPPPPRNASPPAASSGI